MAECGRMEVRSRRGVVLGRRTSGELRSLQLYAAQGGDRALKQGLARPRQEIIAAVEVKAVDVDAKQQCSAQDHAAAWQEDPEQVSRCGLGDGELAGRHPELRPQESREAVTSNTGSCRLRRIP